MNAASDSLPSAALAYVVLHHAGWPGRSDHYDILLQLEATRDLQAPLLLSFATLNDNAPAMGARLKKLPLHRTHYLHFDGTLSGDRGSVKRFDCGELRWMRQEESVWLFSLIGQRYKGNYQISKDTDGTYLWYPLTSPPVET